MNKTLKICVAIGTLLASSLATQAGNFAIGPKVGTLGVGAEGLFKFNDFLSFGAQINGFKYSKKLDKGNVGYSGKLKLLNFGGTANFHPFLGGFKITGGLFANFNKIDVNATPNKNITLNGNTYTPAEIGKLTGAVKFGRVSPYLGMGYDSAFSSVTPLSFNCDVGVLFQGKPKTDVSATGLLKGNAQLIKDANKNLYNASNKSYVRFYPVISLGLKYRF